MSNQSPRENRPESNEQFTRAMLDELQGMLDATPMDTSQPLAVYAARSGYHEGIRAAMLRLRARGL